MDTWSLWKIEQWITTCQPISLWARDNFRQMKNKTWAMKKGAPGCLGYVGDDVLHTYESLWNNQDSMESIREFFRGLENCVVFFFGLVWVLIFHLLLIFWSIEFLTVCCWIFFPQVGKQISTADLCCCEFPFWKKRWCFLRDQGIPDISCPKKVRFRN